VGAITVCPPRELRQRRTEYRVPREIFRSPVVIFRSLIAQTSENRLYSPGHVRCSLQSGR
jgi:hypothetical protein